MRSDQMTLQLPAHPLARFPADPAAGPVRAVPRWATPPNPDRPNDLRNARRVARMLGRPLLPWQDRLIAVATERLPDGRPAYRRTVAVVPRRAGKTHVALVLGLVDGLNPSGRAFYASHRRETAAALWRDEWFPLIEHSPARPHIAMRRANGSESIAWRDIGSTLRLLPPDGDAARSFRSTLAVIDEARELTADQGADLEAGIFPTQATGRGGRTVILSNAGKADADWLRKWRDLGRAAVEDGRTDGIAYLEFGADDDADLDDPAVWAACHPGIGHHVDVAALAADRAVMTPTDFAVEYLGVWPEVLTDAPLLDAWQANVVPDAGLADPVAFAVEITEDRDRAVIVAAGAHGDRVAVELVEDRPHDGGTWLPARLAELAATHRPVAVVWDRHGPAASLAADLVAVTAPLDPLPTGAVLAAAAGWHDQVIAGGVVHRGDPAMTAAVTALRRRRVSGAWVYDRREVDSLPAIAAALALHAARRHYVPTVY